MRLFSRFASSTRSSPRPAVRPAPVRRAARSAVEGLESRQLMTAVVTQDLPDVFGDAGGSSASINLLQFFDDDDRSLVRMTFPTGSVDIETLDDAAPLNAANFLAYVTSGRYNNSVFHRSVPGFVLQGGSFYPDGSNVPAFAPVMSEPNNGRSNVRGTLAFARLPAFDDANENGVQDPGEQNIPGGGPNSATNGFFFNLVNNGGNLDNQNGGFTVFGSVVAGRDAQGNPVADGMTVVDALVGLPTLQRVINSAAAIADVTYTVSSDDPAVANPVLNGSQLVIQYGQTQGAANVTVTATGKNGQAVSQTFTAGVGQLDVTLGGPGGNKSVTFNDVDGTATTIALRGAGTASVRLVGAGLTQSAAKGRVTVGGAAGQLTSVALMGTNASTAVTITARGGDDAVVIGGLTADGAVRSIAAPGAALTGTLSTGGALGSLTLGSADGATITIGGSSGAAALAIDQAVDATITSAIPIRSIRTTTFNTAAATPGVLTAPSIGSITAVADFAQTLQVAGGIGSFRVGGSLLGNVTAGSIKTLSVNMDITNATITLTQPFAARARALNSATVRGVISNSTIRTTAGIGSITADALDGATIFAGVPGSTLPTVPGNFATQASIANLRLVSVFSNSSIAAANLGKVSLGLVLINNNDVPFGIAADRIASLSGQTSPQVRFAFRRLETAADLQAQANGLDLDDARINVV